MSSYLPVGGLPLPASPENERAALCCMVQHPGACIPFFREKASWRHFSDPVLQAIYGYALELFDGRGGFDLWTLQAHLEDLNELQSVGGAVFLTLLFSETVALTMMPHYVEILTDKLLRRELIALAEEQRRAAFEERSEAGELIAEASQRVEQLRARVVLKTRLPPLCDASLMIGARRPPHPPQIVSGLLHQGSKLIVGGTSKGMKTYTLIDLAVSVAAGVAWWGFQCPEEDRSVCYINFEIQPSFFAERVEDVCRAKSVELGPGRLRVWNLRGHGEGIERLRRELLDVLLRESFALVIFDPIYKALGDRDENKAGDVATMLNELERIAVETGAAIAFGAHFSKGNQAAKDAIDRIGGSGVFARDPDSILTMTAHAEDNAFAVDARLRNFKPIDPFVVRWNWPIFTRDDEADPTELKQQKRAANGGQFTPKYHEQMLLDDPAMSAGDDGITGIKRSDLQKRMKAAHNMPRATFYSWITRLLHDGKLREVDGRLFKV
jgi:hypothetical protein